MAFAGLDAAITAIFVSECIFIAYVMYTRDPYMLLIMLGFLLITDSVVRRVKFLSQVGGVGS
jgi:hypothetical protein